VGLGRQTFALKKRRASAACRRSSRGSRPLSLRCRSSFSFSPPQRDAAGRFVIYVEETYVDQLKALRRAHENYSDVILRLAEPEGTRATVVKLVERG